jgi:hypothetical protein
MKSKRGIVWSEITWWIIGLTALALITIAIILSKQRGIALIEEIKEMFRFGK